MSAKKVKKWAKGGRQTSPFGAYYADSVEAIELLHFFGGSHFVDLKA
jgi:hypothetical protein